MKQRTEQELEQLSQKLMMSGSKVCPDCQKPALAILMDANCLKIRCNQCDFHFEDFYGG